MSEAEITGRERRSDPENSDKDDFRGWEVWEEYEAREERRHEGSDAYESLFRSLCLYLSTNGLCLLRLATSQLPQTLMVVAKLASSTQILNWVL